MRRLLQLGTLMLLVGVVLPVQEMFDAEEQAGLFEDTEFAIFALIATICLILLVCKLIAAAMLRVCLLWLRGVLCAETSQRTEPAHTFIFAVPPLLLIPLRI
jgi:hypothetical protein